MPVCRRILRLIARFWFYPRRPWPRMPIFCLLRLGICVCLFPFLVITIIITHATAGHESVLLSIISLMRYVFASLFIPAFFWLLHDCFRQLHAIRQRNTRREALRLGRDHLHQQEESGIAFIEELVRRHRNPMQQQLGVPFIEERAPMQEEEQEQEYSFRRRRCRDTMQQQQQREVQFIEERAVLPDNPMAEVDQEIQNPARSDQNLTQSRFRSICGYVWRPIKAFWFCKRRPCHYCPNLCCKRSLVCLFFAYLLLMTILLNSLAANSQLGLLIISRGRYALGSLLIFAFAWCLEDFIRNFNASRLRIRRCGVVSNARESWNPPQREVQIREQRVILPINPRVEVDQEIPNPVQEDQSLDPHGIRLRLGDPFQSPPSLFPSYTEHYRASSSLYRKRAIPECTITSPSGSTKRYEEREDTSQTGSDQPSTSQAHWWQDNDFRRAPIRRSDKKADEIAPILLPLSTFQEICSPSSPSIPFMDEGNEQRETAFSESLPCSTPLPRSVNILPDPNITQPEPDTDKGCPTKSDTSSSRDTSLTKSEISRMSDSPGKASSAGSSPSAGSPEKMSDSSPEKSSDAPLAFIPELLSAPSVSSLPQPEAPQYPQKRKKGSKFAVDSEEESPVQLRKQEYYSPIVSPPPKMPKTDRSYSSKSSEE